MNGPGQTGMGDPSGFGSPMGDISAAAQAAAPYINSQQAFNFFQQQDYNPFNSGYFGQDEGFYPSRFYKPAVERPNLSGPSREEVMAYVAAQKPPAKETEPEWLQTYNQVKAEEDDTYTFHDGGW